jgi:hypothetical protein
MSLELLFDQLMLVGLLWLCLLLHRLWLHDRAAPGPKGPRPATPGFQRSREPKPFAGLTVKPHCAACAQSATPPQLPPAVGRVPTGCG